MSEILLTGMLNNNLCENKGADQISFAVTAKLISTFVFSTRRVQFFNFLNPKFPASHNLSSGGPSEPQSFQEQSSSITRTAYRSQTTTEPAPRQEAEASYTRNRAKESESQETQQQRLYYESRGTTGKGFSQ